MITRGSVLPARPGPETTLLAAVTTDQNWVCETQGATVWAWPRRVPLVWGSVHDSLLLSMSRWGIRGEESVSHCSCLEIRAPPRRGKNIRSVSPNSSKRIRSNDGGSTSRVCWSNAAVALSPEASDDQPTERPWPDVIASRVCRNLEDSQNHTGSYRMRQNTGSKRPAPSAQRPTSSTRHWMLCRPLRCSYLSHRPNEIATSAPQTPHHAAGTQAAERTTPSRPLDPLDQPQRLKKTRVFHPSPVGCWSAGKAKPPSRLPSPKRSRASSNISKFDSGSVGATRAGPGSGSKNNGVSSSLRLDVSARSGLSKSPRSFAPGSSWWPGAPHRRSIIREGWLKKRGGRINTWGERYGPYLYYPPGSHAGR